MHLLHPFLPQLDLTDYRKRGYVFVTAYTPFGKANSDIMNHPALVEIVNCAGTTDHVIMWFVKKRNPKERSRDSAEAKFEGARVSHVYER